MEVWKDIPGFEGSYQASTHGRVCCLLRVINRKGRDGSIHTIVREQKILTPKKRGEYLGVQLSHNMFGRKSYLLHRIILGTFVDNPEYKEQVNHKDGNKHNNNLYNLEWATRSENQLHRYRVLNK